MLLGLGGRIRRRAMSKPHRRRKRPGRQSGERRKLRAELAESAESAELVVRMRTRAVGMRGLVLSIIPRAMARDGLWVTLDLLIPLCQEQDKIFLHPHTPNLGGHTRYNI